MGWRGVITLGEEVDAWEVGVLDEVAVGPGCPGGEEDGVDHRTTIGRPCLKITTILLKHLNHD